MNVNNLKSLVSSREGKKKEKKTQQLTHQINACKFYVAGEVSQAQS